MRILRPEKVSPQIEQLWINLCLCLFLLAVSYLVSSSAQARGSSLVCLLGRPRVSVTGGAEECCSLTCSFAFVLPSFVPNFERRATRANGIGRMQTNREDQQMGREAAKQLASHR